MADEFIADSVVEDAAAAGYARCVNARVEGMSILRPAEASIGEAILRHDELLATFGTEQLGLHYAELLLRADALLAFLQGNVGATADYPIRVRGESREAVSEFYRQVARLETIVGLLMES